MIILESGLSKNARVHFPQRYPVPAMSREYIARDPRTGRPINVGGGRRQSKKREIREGPWMAIPPQAVIPLITGEIESYRSRMERKRPLDEEIRWNQGAFKSCRC